jgi:hypothetical protein
MENTATSNAWDQMLNRQPLLCSACDPTIGHWHGRFERRPAPTPFPEDAEFRAAYGIPPRPAVPEPSTMGDGPSAPPPLP